MSNPPPVVAAAVGPMTSVSVPRGMPILSRQGVPVSMASRGGRSGSLWASGNCSRRRSRSSRILSDVF